MINDAIKIIGMMILILIFGILLIIHPSLSFIPDTTKLKYKSIDLVTINSTDTLTIRYVKKHADHYHLRDGSKIYFDEIAWEKVGEIAN